MLINEKHLRAGDRTKFANICFYSYRNDRQHGPGGGTVILIKRTFNHYEIPILPLSNREATAIKIELNNNNRLSLISVYNPPDKKVLQTDLNNILEGTTPTIIAGNLNSKHPNWNSRVGSNNGRILKLYVDKQNLQVIGPDKYTHYPYNGNRPDILDIAILQIVVHSVTMTVTTGLNSDHEPVLMNIHNNQPTTPTTTTKTSWHNNTDLIQESISILTGIENAETLEEEVEIFTNTIQTAKTKSQYTVNYSSQRTPITENIKTLIKSKNKAHCKWQKTLNPEDKRAANQLKEKLTQELTEHSDNC